MSNLKFFILVGFIAYLSMNISKLTSAKDGDGKFIESSQAGMIEKVMHRVEKFVDDLMGTKEEVQEDIGDPFDYGDSN